MQYNSWLYLVGFLGCLIPLYYLTPLRCRWWVLLAGSAVFYGITCGWLTAVLPVTAAAIWAAALQIDRNLNPPGGRDPKLPREERRRLRALTERRNRRVLAAACILAFGVLWCVKYFNFAGVNLNRLFAALRLSARIPRLRLLMPLGISFYTLSAVSYVADVARGTCRAQRHYGKLLLFLMFFPVVTEGPISRYGQLGEQLAQGHTFDYRRFCAGWQLILWGLFQKVVLADRLDRFTGNLFSHYRTYSGGVIALAILLYTFQLYMDFSGCVDIARGSAELFGIRLAENFRRPFFAVSVNDFWRRWHITLGAWLRDYIFYPLSMSKPLQALSRRSRKAVGAYYAAVLPALPALLGVWAANGIWHGAAWKYVVYGLYYFALTAAGMIFEPAFARVCGGLRIDRNGRGFHLFRILRTFVLVNIGMLIFRADNLTAAGTMLRSVFRPGTASAAHVLRTQGLPPEQAVIVAVGAAVVFAVSLCREKNISLGARIAQTPLPVRWGVYIAAVVLVIAAGAYGPGFGKVDFIYAQF